MKIYYFLFSKLLFQGFRVFCSKFHCISPGLLIPNGFTPECPGHVGKLWNYPQCDSERMERRRRRKKELGRRGAEQNRLKRDFCCCPRTFVLSVEQQEGRTGKDSSQFKCSSGRWPPRGTEMDPQNPLGSNLWFSINNTVLHLVSNSF